MRVKIRVANPAGNITIFVTSPLERSQYAKAANQLLAMKELGGEQVGFIEEKVDGTFHMEMMGGEFCGNATRTFGYLMSLWREDGAEKVSVDVSGSGKPLCVEVNHGAGTSRTTMPLPEKMVDFEVPGYGNYHMVVFDGISHVIVKGPKRDEAFVESVLETAEKLQKSDACGIMFLEPGCDGLEKSYRMTPVVYVKETDSLVWESSCGSGSMASAIYLAKRKNEGTYTYILRQPGGIIEASVTKKDGKTVQCEMGGPVSVSEEMEVEIEV